MKKQFAFMALSLFALPAFAQIEVIYPEFQFQGRGGVVSVPVTEVCHQASDDTLHAVVGGEALSIERTKDTPLIVEVPIVQTRADGTRSGVGMDYYRIQACK